MILPDHIGRKLTIIHIEVFLNSVNNPLVVQYLIRILKAVVEMVIVTTSNFTSVNIRILGTIYIKLILEGFFVL